MKTNIKFKNIIAYTLILTILTSVPAFAAEGNEKTKKITIEYEDIEELVQEDNLQIKINEISLDDMEDAIDSADDASDGIKSMLRNIDQVSMMLDEIINNPLGDPSMAMLAQATQLSLSLSSSSLDAQIPSSSGADDQVRLAELGYEQAETALINSSQKMFVLIHQLSDNISQLEKNRELLVSQLELATLSLNYGLVSPVTITDLESTILEFDGNYTSMIHQKDTLVLQFKGLLGLSNADDVQLGSIPEVSKEYISEIEFEDDLEKAIKNSMSIKTKKTELNNADANSKTKKYELQLKENEVTLSLTNQYQLLVETMDKLLLSESKLNSLNSKLIREELRYNIGLISLMDLKSITNELEAQKTLVKSNASNLFMEIENYKAMLNGMI